MTHNNSTNKTQPNDAAVAAFLASVDNEQRRADAEVVCALMAHVTGADPRLWGTSIIGFGDTHYSYASDREGDWFVIGLWPTSTPTAPAMAPPKRST